MLTVENLAVGYGEAQVLFGVSFEIKTGETVALIGRNGMGKTTTVRSLLGMLRPWTGSITFDGRRLDGLPSYRIGQAGLGLVPEGREVFPTLTVEENLIATSANRFGQAGWTMARVFELFPKLKERRQNYGSQLSGGEQQMLAIGRALMTNPKLLILDEATEGLAPLIREEIWRCLQMLRGEGQSILVIDKNLDALSRIVDRHLILERGEIMWQGTNAELTAAPQVKERYLQL
jgi:branched-chain amino acid transport system ATP-binding protein